MNDGKDSAPLSQGWSPAWIAAKFILAVPILGVICAAFVSAMTIVVENMMDVCSLGFHIGHFPCDVSLIVCLILLLIVGLGIWLLLWIGRLEVAWNRWRERLERWRS